MTIVFNERLFKHHSNGEIGDYLVKVIKDADDNAILSRTSTKVLGGKPVETVTKIAGKNIGKTNETSSEEQAIKEAIAKIKAQLDKGYVKHLEEAKAPATNALNLPQPMLATAIEKIKETHQSYPACVQQKIDGHRCISTIVNGKVMLYSRGGKEIVLPHISLALQNLFEEGSWDGVNQLDGELYIHGVPRQHISSLTKKLKPETEKVEYHIYDCISDKSFLERSDWIMNLLDATEHPLVCVPTFIAHSFDEVQIMHKEFIGQGYEGTMIRFNSAGYETGKRSKSLAKYKDFQDAEFEIVNYVLGKPDIRAESTYQRPVFVCKEPKTGELFNVTAPGSMIERQALYEQGLDNFIGRNLSVKFFEYTNADVGSGKGVPFLPVAIDIREDL